MKSIFASVLAVIGLSWLEASPTPSANSSATPSASPAKNACAGEEFRQFDFWIGSWIVRDPSGKQVGTSEITAVSGSCAIREQWKGAGGTDGTSLNYYDPVGKRWHQDWVGSDGSILQLQGGMEGSAMVLSASKKTATGVNLNRITWTPLAEGKVKQAWDVSEDDGKTWKSSFVGIYEK